MEDGAITVDERRTKQHLRLITKAIREGWKITTKDRESLLNSIRKLRHSKDPRVRVAVERLLIEADKTNIKRAELALKIMSDRQRAELTREMMDRRTSQPSVNVQVNIDRREIVREALNDPDYLEFLRWRELAENGNAGSIRENGEPREVETSKAPSLPGSNDNGCHNRKGAE